jgi:pyrroline-5-carboxylate reductase
MTSQQKIIGTVGFLGFGNMGGAVARGVVAAGIVPAANILVHDPAFADEALAVQGFTRAGSAEEIFRRADVVLLAVKPQVFKEIAPAWTELVSGLSGKTIVSVMAGIRAEKLRATFPGFTAVRVMPNLGLAAGEGATAIATDGLVEESVALVETIFNSCGTTVRVSENQMDAVTAVSGSGPMYLFEFVGAMTEAGVTAGLAHDVAYELAKQTAKGSLKLLETSADTPEAWTKRVCSPGGTTLAALGVLQAEGFHRIVERAVAAAKKRSEELSA